ncbi:MAG: glycosyltransferase, partial [Eubacteriales bacterium]
MRVLVYGFGGGFVGGIKTFLLDMNDNMSGDCFFDYVVDDKRCERESDINARGGKLFLISERKHIFKNMGDWWKLLRKHKSTSNIIYFNLSSMNYPVPVLLAKMNGYKIILHAHCNGYLHNRIIHKVAHCIGRIILSIFKFTLLTNSVASAQFMFGNKKAKSAILINNAIDANKFKFDLDTKLKMKNLLGIQNKNVVGFVSRISEKKNPMFLIDIFNAMEKIDPNIILLVVGDGDLLQKVKDYSNELGL